MNENIKKVGEYFNKSSKGYTYDFASKSGTHLFFLITKLVIVKESNIKKDKVTVIIDNPTEYKSIVVKIKEFPDLLNELINEEKKKFNT